MDSGTLTSSLINVAIPIINVSKLTILYLNIKLLREKWYLVVIFQRGEADFLFLFS